MKTSPLHIANSCAFALFLLLAAGCSSVVHKPAATLGNPGALSPDPKQTGRYSMVDSSTPLRGYRRLIIEPVALGLPERELQQLSPELRRTLLERAQNSLRAAWENRIRIVDTPSDSTLRLRTTITQLDRSNPVLNAATTALLFVPMDVGGIAVESELTDAADNRRIAAVADARSGSPLRIGASFRSTGQAEKLFDQIVRQFAEEAAGRRSGGLEVAEIGSGRLAKP